MYRCIHITGKALCCAGLARDVAKRVAYAGLALEARACIGQVAKDTLKKDLPAVTSNRPEPDTMQDQQYFFADETLRAAIRAGSNFA